MKQTKTKYLVLVDYENSIQGELCLVAHNLTLQEALKTRDDLIKQQNDGKILDDFIIHDPEKSGIKIVEYVDFVY